ncbi:uncharacterized protein LOC109845492 isoform X2 [Asparagus officinalis]|uniref:uncharacterized protein LOC109845492 isoform X2 n=1 Tax=Asparagus officinalis TaxID=4686 RepID=UPI00098E23C2|nr:uncharacterized protein LOC109845492 isoform X2 [Asparagus officinalis]
MQIHLGEGPGDKLAFLTGKEEIELVERLIRECPCQLTEGSQKILTALVYSSLLSEQQMNVFKPAPCICKGENNHILRKFQPKSVWYVTVLGSLATTQREYVALHAFCRLILQMQNATLKPSRKHFPKHEEQPPAMPECYTPSFIDHLKRTFNGLQLEAIQLAAMHTAAGTREMTN